MVGAIKHSHGYIYSYQDVNNDFRDNNIAYLTNLLKQIVRSNFIINSEPDNNKGNISTSLIAHNLSDQWILDSGENRHMIENLSLSHNYHLDNISHVQVANDNVVTAIGQGFVHISKHLEL